MKKKNENIMYALCIENKDSEDLEKKKIYQVLPDKTAYLYPESYFILVQLPYEAEKALRASA